MNSLILIGLIIDDRIKEFEDHLVAYSNPPKEDKQKKNKKRKKTKEDKH